MAILTRNQAHILDFVFCQRELLFVWHDPFDLHSVKSKGKKIQT